MPLLNATHPTLLDVAKRLDPDGKVAKVVEILNQTNEILDDCVWIEANDVTSHLTTIRTGLPTPTWRKLYGGVQPTKSTTAQVRDSIGDLQAYAEVDARLVDLNNNAPAFRLSEDMAHIEGMNQQFAQTLIYGNEGTQPEAFTGLAPRFNSVTAPNGDNIIRAEGSQPDANDNTSIWLVVWGPNTVHGIYPKGIPGGLEIEDKGRVTAENIDGANGRAEIYRTHYKWMCGMTVRDWRYVVRITLNQEDLVRNAATGPVLFDVMTQALDLVPSLSMGRPAFYMNRRVRSFLRRQIISATTNSTLTQENIGGKLVTMFAGVPVRRCDAILNTEAGV